MDKDFLAQYGIDYDKGVRNCVGDPEFYKKLLSMFLQDECFPRARVAYAAKDYQELFSCMHELKGASGNAALTGLYENILPLVELLRSGSTNDEEISRLFAAAEKAYQRTYDGVTLAIKD